MTSRPSSLRALVEKWRSEVHGLSSYAKGECADELEAALAAGGTLRESIEQLLVKNAYALRALTYREAIADVLALIAVERGTNCTCGEAEGLAVYSTDCPNEYHQQRARKVVERGTAAEKDETC